MKGKLAYMAPEQLRRGALDRRVDVWALGVVAWELLAGRRLFRRETELETMEAILGQDIPLASEVMADVPAELDAIVQRALARDPDARYPTARDMGRDLTRYLAESGLPIGLAEVAEWMAELFPEGRAEKTTLVERALDSWREQPAAKTEAASATATLPTVAQPVRPRRSFLPWVALVAVAFVAAGVGAWLAGLKDGEPPVQADPIVTAPPTPRDAGVATAPEPDAGSIVAAARIEPVVAPPIAEEPSAPTRPRLTKTRPRPSAPEAPAPEPAVDPDAVGTVQVVTTSGWARVTAGGRELGTTPLRANLPAGRHTLTLTAEDGRVRRVPVTVRAGQVAPVAVDLARE